MNWDSAKNIGDIITLNVNYILGNIESSPYHQGALAPDSQQLTEGLVKLNELGFITVNGQGPLDETGFVEQTWIYDGQVCGNWNYRISQRPHIAGFLPTDAANTLINYFHILSEPRVAYSICSLEDGMGESQVYNLTREKSFSAPEDEALTPWTYPTNTPYFDEYSSAVEAVFFNDDISRILYRQYCWVDFLIEDYNSNYSLEDTIVAAFAAIQSGLTVIA